MSSFHLFTGLTCESGRLDKILYAPTRPLDPQLYKEGAGEVSDILAVLLLEIFSLLRDAISLGLNL